MRTASPAASGLSRWSEVHWPWLLVSASWAVTLAAQLSGQAAWLSHDTLAADETLLEAEHRLLVGWLTGEIEDDVWFGTASFCWTALRGLRPQPSTLWRAAT